jgi:small subunit ribosomal protein S7
MAEKKSEQQVMHFFPSLSKYEPGSVKVEDIGLAKYINLDTENIYLGAVFANRMFAKAKIPLVERLINNIMRTEKYNGKKVKAYKVVRDAFDIIEKRLKKNPLQVLVDAIQNAAPKEEATRLRFGGILVPKAVDTSPQRRLDTALRNISQGSVNASHKNKKRMEACLADEIMKAASNDVTSFAVSRKNELERVAKSAR